MNAIIAENLSKDYIQGTKRIEVLKNVSAEFKQGVSYAIVGVSGSGKSTLLHILSALDSPTSGHVSFNNKNLYKISFKEKEQFLHKIGFIFQFHYLIDELSVLENVELAGKIAGLDEKIVHNDGVELLTLLGLGNKLDKFPWQLSGGEQQRVAVARALVKKPMFIFADEPTGNLDAQNAHNILEIFLEFKSKIDMGLILCSHDKAIYSKMDMVYRLENGGLTILEKE